MTSGPAFRLKAGEEVVDLHARPHRLPAHQQQAAPSTGISRCAGQRADQRHDLHSPRTINQQDDGQPIHRPGLAQTAQPWRKPVERVAGRNDATVSVEGRRRNREGRHGIANRIGWKNAGRTLTRKTGCRARCGCQRRKTDQKVPITHIGTLIRSFPPGPSIGTKKPSPRGSISV